MTTETSPQGKEYWLKYSNVPFLGTNVNILGSVIGGLKSNNVPDPEDLDKIIAITRERLLSEKHYLVSVVNDQTNLLPVSFLQMGVRQSLAVCRITRYFSREEFENFIQEIEQEVQKTDSLNSNFNSVAKVKEIFSIPNQVADDIAGFKDSSNPLEVLKNISEVQLAKINPIPIGTGFLVGGTHLLTNNHVIPDREIANQCVAQFNYVEDLQGRVQEITEYELNPELLFITEPSLDYTLVQLQSGMFTRPAGFNFNWLQLIEDAKNIAPGGIPYLQITEDYKEVNKKLESAKAFEELKSEKYKITVDKKDNESIIFLWNPDKKSQEIKYKLKEIQKIINPENFNKDVLIEPTGDGNQVIIVQHPKGKIKQIAYNKVIDNGLYKNFLRYNTDSDYGSSGSPVFNAQWDLVALHHAAVAAQPQVNPIQQENLLKVEAQQGVRICRIVEDLKRKSFSKPKLQSFIEDFVVTYEALNYPPLPSALKFDGESSYIDLGKDESLNITEAITVEAWIQCNPVFEDGWIIQRYQAYSLYWANENIVVTLYNGDKQPQIFYLEKSTLDDNLWHHVTFTWNTKNIQIYIDGKNIGIAYVGGKDIQGNLGKSEESLIIGRDQDRKNYFSGSIAELRIWGVVRTQEQIQANMYRRLNQDEQKGLRGYWRFEEGKGYKVYNLVKSAISSEPSIAPFILNPPIPPKFGLNFNGKNDYIDCGDNENLKIEDAITIEAWVKNDDQNSNGIIVNRGGSWKENGYCLWRNFRKIRVELQNQNEKIIVDTVEEALNDESWHHITFMRNKNSQDIQIYIDGTKKETNPHYEGGSQSFIGAIGKPRVSLNIGCAQGYGICFNGSIAEVRLWGVARTENEIKENMARQLKGTETGLVGYWSLDEEEGDRAKNKVGKNNYGLVYGGQWLKPYSLQAANQGTFGVAFKTKWLRASQYPALPLPFGLKFNEEGDRVECSGEEINTSTAITVEAWVKHKFGNFLIVSRGGIIKQDNSVEKGYSVSWHNGKIRVCLSDGASERVFVYSQGNAPVDRVWHHIAFTWEQSSQEIAIYIDGRLQDNLVDGKSQTIIGTEQNRSIGLFAGTIENPTNLIIGQKEAEETYYNVAVAEVRLWNVVRTQDQIKTNMSFRLDVEQRLIGYWRLDDGGEGNERARNHVFDRNHGKISGAKWFPATP
ncbi:MAG: LamG domain-containing protein [Rhizonema sp. PD37]|nr:LamG domain-containing protein [Rhizonema sp. PD37]